MNSGPRQLASTERRITPSPAIVPIRNPRSQLIVSKFEDVGSRSDLAMVPFWHEDADYFVFVGHGGEDSVYFDLGYSNSGYDAISFAEFIVGFNRPPLKHVL